MRLRPDKGLFNLTFAHFCGILYKDSGKSDVLTGRSAARLARLLREQEVGGSNPLAPIFPNVVSLPDFFEKLIGDCR